METDRQHLLRSSGCNSHRSPHGKSEWRKPSTLVKFPPSLPGLIVLHTAGKKSSFSPWPGGQFDSRPGSMPGLWVGGPWGRLPMGWCFIFTLMFLSVLLSLPFPLRINKLFFKKLIKRKVCKTTYMCPELKKSIFSIKYYTLHNQSKVSTWFNLSMTKFNTEGD